MSETELWIGKAILEKKLHDGETLEEQCQRLLTENNIDVSSYDLNDYLYREILENEELYNEYVIYKDEIYNCKNKKTLEPENISQVSRNVYGEIEFMLGFYNGGACFAEVFEDAMESLDVE